MDFSAFSHGQIQSKLWLCESLEPLLSEKPQSVAIIGSWYNVLAFMLLARNQDLYNHIDGYDVDIESISKSNQINDAWMINKDQKVSNICKDAKDVDYKSYDVIVSTSVEDIGIDWYDLVPEGKLICLQTINLSPEIKNQYPNWIIRNHIPDMETFKQKYPLSNILFEGCRTYDYDHLKYDRYMLIGKK